MGSCANKEVKEVVKDINDIDHCACKLASEAAVAAIKESMHNCECRRPAVTEPAEESNPEVAEEARIQAMVSKAIALALQSSKSRPQTPALSGRSISAPAPKVAHEAEVVPAPEAEVVPAPEAEVVPAPEAEVVA
jgi:hypothetical protein